MESVKQWKKHIRIRTKILIGILLTVSFILTIITVLIYRTTVKTVEAQAMSNIEENSQKTCSLMDTRLAVIKEATEKMNIDSRLYGIFAALDETEPLSLLRASQEIKDIIQDYIPWYSDIYSAHLVTSYYRFGDDSLNYYPSFSKSLVSQKAIEADGKLTWFATYSYTDMYQISNLRDDQIEYGKLFSCARRMNLSDVSSGKVVRLSEIKENPILVINFLPQYFKTVLEKSNTNSSLEDMDYYVMDQGRNVVFSTDENVPLGSKYEFNWVDSLTEEDTQRGFFIEENGQRQLVTYSCSNITGWWVINKIPVSSLIGPISDRYLRYLIIAFFVLFLSAVCIAWFISKGINKQFYNVLGTIERIGHGDFPEIQYDSEDEFAFFYEKLEKMSMDLRNLIHENYEVKLAQRDAQIKALNAQMNPHFLYNTLNIINWTCLEGDMETTSHMLVNLSRMLQYSTYNTSPYVLLRNDLEWLKQYLYIMQLRFLSKFDVLLDVPERLLDIYVPKLFLQPFVENAIVHGFTNMQEKGLLEIHTEEEEGDVIFYVEDNGKGMTAEKAKAVMNGNPDSIGMANVNKRIKILYGEKYGVECYSQPDEGTCVMVRIPLIVKRDQ